MATRIGRSLTPLDSARLWDNAACVVANRTTSTNLSCLFGRVGELNVARETFSAYVQRVVTPQVFLEKMFKGVALGVPNHSCSESNSTHLCLVAQDG